MDKSQIFLGVAAIFSGLVILFTYLSNVAVKKEQQVVDHQNIARQNDYATEIARLGASMGNADMAQKYLELRRASQRYDASTITAIADKALKAKNDHLKFRSEIEEANAAFARTTQVRIEPVQNLVVDRMYGWASALKSRGTKVDCDIQQANPTTLIQERSYIDICTIKFAAGGVVSLQIRQAFVRDSKISDQYQMLFRFSKGQAFDLQWNILSDGRAWQLENRRAGIYSFASLQKNIAGTPIDDEELSERLRTAVDESLSYLVHEADPTL